MAAAELVGKLLKKKNSRWHRSSWNTFTMQELVCLFEPQQFRHMNVVCVTTIFFSLVLIVLP